MPSLNVGAFISLLKWRNSSFVLGIGINQIEGKEKSRIHVYPNTDSNRQDYLRIRRDLTYIGLPISYEFRQNKVKYNLGFDFRYSLLAKERSKETWDEGNQFEANYVFRYDLRSRVSRFDYGIHLGVSFPLTQRGDIEIIGYYGLNNIYSYNGHKKNNPDHPGVWKVQQIIIAYKHTVKS